MNFAIIKKHKIIFATLAIIILYLLSWLISSDNNQRFRYGVTFSQSYAEYLKLNWQDVLIASLDDLKIRDYRLIAYWNLIEPGPGIYNFNDLDWQINEVSKRGGNIILATGLRVPRWPECHLPSWSKNMLMSQLDKANQRFIKQVVNRYKDNKSIIAWQIENEPFLNIFGKCPQQTTSQVAEKINLVKSLASQPVLTTDSGELSSWFPAIKLVNQLGVSVYRRVRQPLIGYFTYPIPPIFYSWHAALLELFFPAKQFYISELQLEPWLNDDIINTTINQQTQALSVKQVNDFIYYARATGLDPIYFWGVEWWYWLKLHGNGDYWQAIKQQVENNDKM
jgi:hypothetical protein